MVEYFDVVDKDDRVVGRAPREKVHRSREWHRAVYVFVFNSRGELFLQERSDEKDSDPGLWTCSVSGHPSSGQNYREAAVRETEEEIGVRVKVRPLFFMKYEPNRHHLWIFEARHDGPFRLDPKEVKLGRFVSMDELKRMVKERSGMFAPEFLSVLERF